MEIAVSIEPKLAGTGGALWRARDLLDDCFFLLNGDSWFDVNLLALAGPIAEDAATAGIIALRRVADAARFGVVQISGERITRFAERPAQPGSGADQRRRLCIEGKRDPASLTIEAGCAP